MIAVEPSAAHRVLVALSLFALIPPGAARSDTAAAEAARLIEQGLSLREKHQDLAALELFKRAYALSHTPRAVAQMGLAESALKQWTDAEEHLRAALDINSDAWINKYRTQLDGALMAVRKHLGSLEVLGGVPGAQLFLNGRQVAVMPLEKPLRVAEGVVVLEVRAIGHEPHLETVEITAGTLSQHSVELRPTGGTVPAATAPPPVVASPSGTGQAALPASGPSPTQNLTVRQARTTTQQATPQSDSTTAAGRSVSVPLRRILGGTGLGLGIVLLGGGVAGYALRESEAKSWQRCVESGVWTTTECADHRSSAATYQNVEIAGFVAGGALTVGSVVLLALPESQRTRSPVTCGPGPGTIGAACAGRF